MDGLHIEGCLGDDGQNIHGMWLSAVQKRSDKDLLVSSSRKALTPGEDVVLLDDQFHPGLAIKGGELYTGRPGYGHHLYRSDT